MGFLKYVRYVIVLIPRIVWCYLTWMNKYARHPERYPLEKRYARIRELVAFIFRHFHVDIDVKGAEYLSKHSEPVVIYANHYSNLDPLFLVSLSERPLSFVAKKETLKYPFIGKILRILEGIPIDRNNLRSQIVAIDKAVKMVENGRNLAIFPQGTRSRQPNLPIGEFKPGSFKISYRTGAPIIACAIYGTFRPFSTKVNFKTYPFWARFFKPIEKEEYLQFNTVDIAPRIQQEIQTEIIEVMLPRDKTYIANLKTKKKK